MLVSENIDVGVVVEQRARVPHAVNIVWFAVSMTPMNAFSGAGQDAGCQNRNDANAMLDEPSQRRSIQTGRRGTWILPWIALSAGLPKLLYTTLNHLRQDNLGTYLHALVLSGRFGCGCCLIDFVQYGFRSDVPLQLRQLGSIAEGYAALRSDGDRNGKQLGDLVL